ncbi:hypothetical protein G9C85_14480 [Halorubellus sp. JP-L1]|uniref:hypothetical protein n=1 Tax=Halorubellus sp. JP-L1 TaxID=2715753 RepID=UPI00140B6FBE|nr:hypothetical protein [Halorubellus sp. JP-L1]NHN42824.1 hypothetical protein [Halorubellus sp. JP-L1]
MTDQMRNGLFTEQGKAAIEKAGYDEPGATSWESRGLGDDPVVPHGGREVIGWPLHTVVRGQFAYADGDGSRSAR